ncbi:MAG: hypothetical protein LT071_03115 [Nocardioides sp.]|nr:hypothetical protein [Nocardioides sp.]
MRQSVSGWLLLQSLLALGSVRDVVGRERDERGDVPGWVMVTVMTAMVVAALMTVVEDELKDLLRNAFDSVRQ